MKPRITPKTMLNAPCIFCDYDGPRYWNRKSHEKNCPWRSVSGKRNREKEFKNAVKRQSIRLGMYQSKGVKREAI